MGISKFRHLIPSSILPYLTELEWQAAYGVNINWTPVGTPVYMPTRNRVPAYIVSDGNDHCLCRKWYKTGKPMLQCEKCGHWYHLQCAGVAADEADSVDFICHICTAPSPAQAAQQQQGSTPREPRRGLRELDSNVTPDGPWGPRPVAPDPPQTANEQRRGDVNFIFVDGPTRDVASQS